MIRKKSEIERKNIALIGIIKNNETNQELEPQSFPQHISAAPEGSLFKKKRISIWTLSVWGGEV